MIPIHVIDKLDGAVLAQNDRLLFGRFKIANLIGGGAGAAVATAVTSVKNLPADFSVVVIPDQDATYWISARTVNGFTINLLPRLAANTLAVGTMDVLIFG